MMGAAISSSTWYSTSTPADTSTAGAVGTSLQASRADHVHAVGALSVGTGAVQDGAITSAKLDGGVGVESLIAEKTAASATTVSWTTGFSSGFKRYKIILTSADTFTFYIKFNNDATAAHYTNSNGFTSTASSLTNSVNAASTSGIVISTGSTGAGNPATLFIEITDMDASTHKYAKCAWYTESGTSAPMAGQLTGAFNQTANITQIDVIGASAWTGKARLYGIA